MRYFLRDGALFIRGAFTAVMSGTQETDRDSRITRISTIIATHLPHNNTTEDADTLIGNLLRKSGYDTDAIILPVPNHIDQLRVFAYDGIMVFILAQPGKQGERPDPVTVIVCCREPLPEASLRLLQNTAEDAIHQAFIMAGFPAGSGTDTFLTCCGETEEYSDFHARLARAEALVTETIAYGIPETWATSEIPFHRKPPFYIHSSIGGERWTRWIPDGCPYYPCHPSCEGQRCDFCYCPLYPCGDESQGKWLERENSGKIWSCEGCTLVHEPTVADYLIHNPEASLKELKNIRKKGKNKE
ncbi:cysteine-rich small domain-containing protein [Methanogenium marinum]|uniref:Cysteine-rich small domain-containing protein n=1 Tax=Methanogenium marinum TaxID=348610 RepID=A0A9Q4KTT6_9EURY|nr:cysteine-rich small domain-containing protein [Methanogenium marinum]MDE4908687.1 cysteine-rich small domain-containing protein [Methanogenium marinum]